MPENDPAISTRDAGVVARTGVALKIAGTRWDTRLAFLGASLLYVVVYLFTVGDLSVITGSEGVTVRIADDLSRALVSRGFFRFDAIALVSVGPVSYLFAPLNLVVASVLAGLVGANVALTSLGYTQPRACGLESSTGVLAGIPALLSGAACCGPTILVVIGVQASATLITAFRLLVPVAIVLLVGGLLLIGRQIDPGLL